MDILRYAAFTTTPAGGNPAGVVLDAATADAATMLRVAAEVGYSETAFITGGLDRPGRDLDIRYFSPQAEVPFCGHATIATAVAFAERHGPGDILLHTPAGPVTVHTRQAPDRRFDATLVSVPPRTAALDPADLAEILAALGWSPDDLDPALPPRVAYAGAHHPILAVRTRARLAALDYDVDRLGALMALRDWTTVDLVFRESDHLFHARNPFPPGGVYEDPATGAAAAAFGGYLRELGLIDVPGSFVIHQGEDMGRPGTLLVAVPADPGTGISVTGSAVPLD